jgi:hypothetical protein
LTATFRIVLAAPSDVDAECKSVEQIVAELNRVIGPYVDCEVRLTWWRTDVAPGFHADGPQGVIDARLRINEADALLGIFWRRFGTPTEQAGSGTEHEFRTAYDSWKATTRPRVMMYFCEKPATPHTPDELAQWAKVLEFRESFPREGLFWTYSAQEEFEGLVRIHLTQVLLDAMDVVGPRRKALRGLLNTVDDSRDLRFVYSSTRVRGFVDYRRRRINYPFTERERRVTAIPDTQGIAILHCLLETIGKRERIHVMTAHDFHPESWRDDIIFVGSPNANPPTGEALERANAPFRFTDAIDGIIDLRGHPCSLRWPTPSEELHVVDYALLVKSEATSPAGRSTQIVAAGLGGIGTFAACYYLHRNATDLFRVYGTRSFACVLRVPSKDRPTHIELVDNVELSPADAPTGSVAN